jgi:hypothetical protein
MNDRTIERLKIVRQAILEHKDQFVYYTWSAEIDKLAEENTAVRSNQSYIDVASRIQNDCGTCGCVAGFTVSCIPSDTLPILATIHWNNIFDVAARWLGIDDEMAKVLFYGRGWWFVGIGKSLPNIPDLRHTTYETAISRLDILIEYFEYVQAKNLL